MSFVRFVQAIFGSPNVNIYIRRALLGAPEMLLYENLAYGQATPYLKIDGNTQYEIIVRPNLLGANPLATLSFFPSRHRDYTLIIEGTLELPGGTAPMITAFTDSNGCHRKGCRASLRFIHAAALTASTAINLLADGYVIYQNVLYPDAGVPAYIPAKATEFNFSVTATATGAVLVPSFPLHLRKDHVYTLIVIGDPNSGLTVLPLVNRCHNEGCR